MFASPYLNSIHASAITCLTHVFDVSEAVYEQLVKAGEIERRGKVSDNAWPVKGGRVKSEDEDKSRDVLVTGHEDGSVKVWGCSGMALALICSVKTSKFFTGDDLDEPLGEAENERFPVLEF